MEQIENVLKFLDCASRTLREESRSKEGLNDKIALHAKSKKFAECRQLLRSQYFAYEDWIETGEYEAPAVYASKPIETVVIKV